jgi:hypothetical protein
MVRRINRATLLVFGRPHRHVLCDAAFPDARNTL